MPDSLTPEQIEQLKALGWASRHHPMWAMLRLVVCVGSLFTFLWLNASHFDATEWKTIGGVLLTMLGYEGGALMMGRKA